MLPVLARSSDHLLGADGACQVGRKRVLTKPAEIGEKGLYEFFQAVELELELPMDDQRDNPDG